MDMDFIEYPDLVSSNGYKLSIMAIDEKEMGPKLLAYDKQTGSLAWYDLEEVRVDVTSRTHDDEAHGADPITLLRGLLKDAEAMEALIRLVKAYSSSRSELL